MAVLATGALLASGAAAAASAAILDRPATLPDTRAVAVADADRQAAAARADRAERPMASPSAASPTALPSPAAPAPTVTAKPAPPKPTWVAPMFPAQITSCFGPRWGTLHPGIDFANVAGTPIHAASAGTVISAGWDSGGYGYMVIIQHGPNLYTLYGHSQRVLVTVGQRVVAGQTIALEGATGDATGPHLHFEAWTAMWSRIDPAPFLRSVGVAVNGC